jgi:hypothetical protein
VVIAWSQLGHSKNRREMPVNAGLVIPVIATRAPFS